MFIYIYIYIYIYFNLIIYQNGISHNFTFLKLYYRFYQVSNFTAISLVSSSGVHGSGWVGLRGFFDPTHHGGSKKIQLNPTHHINPTQPTWVGLGRIKPMGLTNLLLLLNWVEKNININILKKPKDLYQYNSLKANNTND